MAPSALTKLAARINAHAMELNIKALMEQVLAKGPKRFPKRLDSSPSADSSPSSSPRIQREHSADRNAAVLSSCDNTALQLVRSSDPVKEDAKPIDLPTEKEWDFGNYDVLLRQQGLSWDEVGRVRRSRGLGKGRGPRRQALELQEKVLQAARAIVEGASASVHGNDYGDVSAQSSPRLFR